MKVKINVVKCKNIKYKYIKEVCTYCILLNTTKIELLSALPAVN